MVLINIRCIQIKRELINAGPSIIVIFFIFCVLVYASFTTYQTTTKAIYLTAFLYFLCLSLQFYRKDKSFVYNHIDKSQLEIYSEYLLLTFPFAVSSLFTGNWFCYPILIASLYAIPYLKYTLKQKTYFKNISSIIPASNFEWISAFRKSFLFLIPLYILAICFCWFRILPLLLLWLITVTITSYYNECESLQILKEGNFSSKRFLEKKLFQHSKYLVLLYLPVLIVNTVFNFEYWLVNLLFIPVQLSLLCFAICLKYSNYQPGELSISNNITLAIVSIGSVFPYFLPIPLIMAVRYYRKAEIHLAYYLND